jgi:hypothetical protein
MGMRAAYKRTLEARELPTTWREEGRFVPDEQVTVVVTPAARAGSGSLKRFVGAGKGLFRSAEEIDTYISRQRDAWGS